MMSIEFIAVKCFNDDQGCGTFQVTQRRKDNKWQCKLCHEKQSIRKVYAVSFKAADLRPVVQKYNLERGQKIEQAPPKRKSELQEIPEEQLDDVFQDHSGVAPQLKDEKLELQPKKSKWSKYLEEEEETQNKEEPEDPIFVTSLPDIPKRGGGRGGGRGRGTKSNVQNEEQDGFFEDDTNQFDGFANASNSKGKNSYSRGRGTYKRGTFGSQTSMNSRAVDESNAPFKDQKPLKTIISQTPSISKPSLINQSPLLKAGPKPVQVPVSNNSSSKWSKYLDKEDKNEAEAEAGSDDDEYSTNLDKFESFAEEEEEIDAN